MEKSIIVMFYLLRFLLTVVACMGSYYLIFYANAIGIAAKHLGLSYTLGDSLIIDLIWFLVVATYILESFWSLSGKIGVKNEAAPPLLSLSLKWTEWVILTSMLLFIVGVINTLTSELLIVSFTLLSIAFIGQRIKAN